MGQITAAASASSMQVPSLHVGDACGSQRSERFKGSGMSQTLSPASEPQVPSTKEDRGASVLGDD